MKYLLVVNAAAGSSEAEDLVLQAKKRLVGVDVFSLEPESDVAAAIADAVADDRIVVAVGGDGTVNAVAQHLVGRGTLGVLPGGTLNHFARDLGIRDVDAAFDALQAGDVQKIDLGRAGEHVFVNNAGMGLYPELVRERERRAGLLGKWADAAGAAFRVLRRAYPVSGSIAADGDERLLSAWIVFVGNNRFDTTPGRIGERDRLDEGVLEVRVLTASSSRAERPYLAYGVLRGNPAGLGRLVKTYARDVRIKLTGSPRLVSRDGETGKPVTELTVEVLPRALTVVAPKRG